jgi:multidrug efflux pump subunit AcrA (membrane-fusion protein)
LRIFAPEALLHRGADGPTTAWLVDSGRNAAELRSVVVGSARLGDWVEVREGLRPGDRLIAGDVARLRPGQRIRVIGEALAPDAQHGDVITRGSAAEPGGADAAH